jgi:transcriptional regulator with XRE-family HTH domain
MTEQLIEIGQRLKALREIVGLTEAEMAEKCGTDVKTLREYERGERDFSFSFLYCAAGALEVDVLDLMSGESPRLSICSVVKNGEGLSIERRKAYSYKHLAYTFRNKKAEPFMVEVESKDGDETPERHGHEGQEFNYVVEGSMDFFIGDMTYVLETGDSVYFDSSVPHAMRARGGKKTRFIAVVMK